MKNKSCKLQAAISVAPGKDNIQPEWLQNSVAPGRDEKVQIERTTMVAVWVDCCGSTIALGTKFYSEKWLFPKETSKRSGFSRNSGISF